MGCLEPLLKANFIFIWDFLKIWVELTKRILLCEIELHFRNPASSPDLAMHMKIFMDDNV